MGWLLGTPGPWPAVSTRQRALLTGGTFCGSSGGYGREPKELQGAQVQLPSAGAPKREIKAEPEQHSSTSILHAGRVAMVGRDTDGTHRLLWGHLGVLLAVFMSTAKS